MRLHCEKVLSKMDGKTIEDWGKDENLRDAVCLRLQQLAECVKKQVRCDADLPARFPHIPWDEIIRFRDKIAHHYEGVDYDMVWEIIETDIPPLHAVILELDHS
ncbi:MAG: DUF86 domain-containing protein [Desulfovibrionaceae bacterium]